MARRRGGAAARVRIAGIPLRLRASWLIVAAAIVLLFGPQVARIFPELGAGAYAVALAYAGLLLVSVLAHELAHALSARAFGWPSTEIELNLWGGHTEFLAADSTPTKSLAVSLAGPAANLVIAGIGWWLIETFTPVGVLGMLASVTVLMNFLVGVFNLLPGLPLDGGRLVESTVWAVTGSQRRGALAAGWAGRVVVAGLVVAAVWLLIGDGGTNLVVVVVAAMVSFFLWQGASDTVAAARAGLRRERREGRGR
ncbi:site-2 protease family protein [Nesterenkonia sp. F]|uniref:site-2 protease family protein n=1 Tax=Nesterenkonia sp. F TaxID=795955 RepID=UPI000255D1D6|nr:site-2 protease family protein [Nesterenkonia sp. F]